MKQKSKSQKRIQFIELISEAVTNDDIFGTINHKNQSEDQIKQFIYPHLVDSLAEYVVSEKNIDKSSAKELVKTSLKWEGNVNTTVNHILFMGTQNRPDMILEMNGLKIAIEFKHCGKGSDLRSGIGQSMIYSTHYDFVLYVFIDTTEDKRILNAQSGVNETEFVDLVWDQYNIKFIVV
jgi:hypothetical protein